MKKSLLAVAALTFSGAALAGPKWTYIDAGYIGQSSAEEVLGTKDSEGYELEGSFGFLDIWHVNGLYGNAETKFVGGGSDEVDYYRIGAGVHPAITDTTDLVAELGYIQWDVKGANAEPDAIDLVIGVRSMLTERFELNAFLTTQIGSSDLGSSNDDFTIYVPSVGGQYFFTDNFSVNLSYEWGSTQNIVLSSKDSARFGVRWSF